MLEHPGIRRYSFVSESRFIVIDMSSDNPFGAGNQQETEEPVVPLDPWWVGRLRRWGRLLFCGHPSEREVRTTHWRLATRAGLPGVQHEKERELLDRVCRQFGCGRIVSKGPRSRVLTYAVSSMSEIREQVIPFFEALRPLVKGPRLRPLRGDREIDAEERAPGPGRLRSARAACLRDERARQAALETARGHPAGILRDCTLGATARGGDETVRSSRRRGESGRNDLTSSDTLRSNNNA
jgi:hypothetical protein